MTEAANIWAVVPAAGIGSRMQADMPKQYMLIDDRPVLAHTLERLLSVPQVTGVVVALQAHDHHWDNIVLNTEKPVIRAEGGAERSDSVLSALQALAQQAGFDADRDWVLVHDAVRPCVHVDDIEHLIEAVGGNQSGGLLAVQVRDTMKRQNEAQQVSETVERNGLWHAQTPQLFPWRCLHDALTEAIAVGVMITDEAFAMERAGYAPLLVTGRDTNIKITRMDDLRLASMIMREDL